MNHSIIIKVTVKENLLEKSIASIEYPKKQVVIFSYAKSVTLKFAL